MFPLTTKNSTGGNMQPCLTPLPTTKGAERVGLCSTRHLAPSYVDLMIDTNLLGILLLLSAIQRLSLSTLPKAFSKSTKNANRNGIQHSVFSMINRSVFMWSTPEDPGLKPSPDVWWNKDGLLYSDSV